MGDWDVNMVRFNVAQRRVVSVCSMACALALAAGTAQAQSGGGLGREGVSTAATEDASAQSPAPASATGQNSGARPTSVDEQAPKWSLSLRPGFEHTFDAELRDSGATSSVTRAGVSAGLSVSVTEQFRVFLNGEFESSWYRWRDVQTLLPSGRKPIGNAFLARFTPGAAYSIDNEWSVLGGAIIEYAGERGVDWSRAATYGGYGGVKYRVNDSLAFTGGLIVKSRLEDDTLVVPLVGVEWAINDKLTLASDDLGLKLSAKINEQWQASIFGKFELRDFRLKDDGAISEGVVRDSRIPIGATVRWTPTPRVSVELSGGAVVYQRWTFDDRDGNRVETDRTRPAGFVGINASIGF